MVKYVCPIKYYPNCRKHDGGYYDTVKFFRTLEELMNYALESRYEYAIVEIFNISGEICGKINYELGSHNCNGIILEIENKKYRTNDNGFGKLKWSIDDR